MKSLFRNIFSPILNIFESGNDEYLYKKSHRIILIVMGILFTGLASLVYVLAEGEDIGYLLPVVVFGGAGLLSLLIGFIGEDKAVAKIWGSGIK
ncbi:MAG: hypothetical protein DIZ80_16970 [endosymbiont of Galathealinum brachiosum]|uniref:Uncharacterized protein n=1 Tax=endosymbiont of Galathealinum brachiosum TaxID=2200906 RepID=A0A370D6T1_9GAMM|nr:MAG: hypothetical protein DIZ80_16970 [endosymbiont of Galathealinum brachiosum]